MKISTRGILEIAEHEGIVPAPYRDSVGVWTWGIGHTKAAGNPDPARMPMEMPADLDAALDAVIAQFRIDVARYDARVRDAVKVPLAQHQRPARPSFSEPPQRVSAPWDFRSLRGKRGEESIIYRRVENLRLPVNHLP